MSPSFVLADNIGNIPGPVSQLLVNFLDLPLSRCLLLVILYDLRWHCCFFLDLFLKLFPLFLDWVFVLYITRLKAYRIFCQKHTLFGASLIRFQWFRKTHTIFNFNSLLIVTSLFCCLSPPGVFMQPTPLWSRLVQNTVNLLKWLFLLLVLKSTIITILLFEVKIKKCRLVCSKNQYWIRFPISPYPPIPIGFPIPVNLYT